jgi:hypothetical protein
MVESSRQILDDISSDERQTVGGEFDARNIIDYLARLRIALDGDSIRLRVEKDVYFPIQIRDMFFGPFDL